MNRRNFIAGVIGSLFLPNIIKEKLPEPKLPRIFWATKQIYINKEDIISHPYKNLAKINERTIV